MLKKNVLPKLFLILSILSTLLISSAAVVHAQDNAARISVDGNSANTATASSTEITVVKEETPIPSPRSDITQKTEVTIEPLTRLLDEQQLGPVLYNPLKYAIRGAVSAGVPPNTVVLLLLLPVVAALIAGFRHLVGVRGFGIFLPAALSVVFVATGPIVGIGLFVVIVFMSTSARMILRKSKVRLQYLPRMAMILLFVVFGVLLVLFTAPIIREPDFANVSIFPVLILALLAEDISRVQLGKSARVAVNLTIETLILALVSFVLLTLEGVQRYVLLNPEITIMAVLVFDFLMGKYVGLRFMEYWRFRKLING
jgi:hypothetical protein